MIVGMLAEHVESVVNIGARAEQAADRVCRGEVIVSTMLEWADFQR